MSQHQSYFGQFRISSAMDGFTVHNASSNGTSACELNSGIDLYIAGANAESTEHLCELVQNSIRGQTNHTNAVCNYAPSTGRVSVHLSESSNIYWSDMGLGNTLGFSNQWVNALQVHTGDKQPRYVWRPTRGLADFPLDINAWWGQRSTSKVTRSVDGTVRTIQGNRLRDGRYSYRNLPKLDVVKDHKNHADDFRSLEQFWADCVHAGAVIRVYPDRTTQCITQNHVHYHDGAIVTEESTGEAMAVGGFEEVASRSQPPWDVLWDVDFSMIKNV